MPLRGHEMPIYEYECPYHDNNLRFELLRPISEASNSAPCPQCGKEAQRVVSRMSWHMGWNFLKGRKSVPAPEDSGYHPEWDEAYKT